MSLEQYGKKRSERMGTIVTKDNDAGRLSVKLVKNGTLMVYPGYPHGMLTIHADVINPDLLAFIRA